MSCFCIFCYVHILNRFRSHIYEFVFFKNSNFLLSAFENCMDISQSLTINNYDNLLSNFVLLEKAV